MGDRLRCAFVSLMPAADWRVRDAVHGGVTLQSPRGDGTVHFSTVPMPDDLGSYDVRRLWERTERPSSPFKSQRFDKSEHAAGGTACIAFSTLLDVAALERWLGRVEIPDALAAKIAANPRPVRRDWCMAHGSRLVDVIHSGASDPDGADIADCEEMVRSVRFEV
jgi:hypothetical protein